jgi:hypothetical protein
MGLDWRSRRKGFLCCVVAMVCLASLNAEAAELSTPSVLKLPVTHATTLDERSLVWPRDLVRPTVLVLGFSRGAGDATTAWEKALRSLATAQAIDFYDMPVVAGAPAFLRPIIIKSIRKQVPTVARAHILPITEDEAKWKQLSGYLESAPDAAYLILVDTTGVVRWSSREDFSETHLTQLVDRLRTLR